ncbi:hypothetical protein BS78_06G275600 [Paspalum vaginatum]|nr:hypothetical protein BS78_06G275600 [Paspalum vaginatum]
MIHGSTGRASLHSSPTDKHITQSSLTSCHNGASTGRCLKTAWFSSGKSRDVPLPAQDMPTTRSDSNAPPENSCRAPVTNSPFATATPRSKNAGASKQPTPHSALCTRTAQFRGASKGRRCHAPCSHARGSSCSSSPPRPWRPSPRAPAPSRHARRRRACRRQRPARPMLPRTRQAPPAHVTGILDQTLSSVTSCAWYTD